MAFTHWIPQNKGSWPQPIVLFIIIEEYYFQNETGLVGPIFTKMLQLHSGKPGLAMIFLLKTIISCWKNFGCRSLGGSCKMGDGRIAQHGKCTKTTAEGTSLQSWISGFVERGGLTRRFVEFMLSNRFLLQYYRMELLNADKVRLILFHYYYLYYY